MALTAYNFVIKYRMEKMNPINILLTQFLGTGGLLKKYYTTTALKGFGNARPPTQSKSFIRCIGKQVFYRGVTFTATSWRLNGGILRQYSIII